MSSSIAKQVIMSSRRHVAVEAIPLSYSNEVYNAVKKHPGYTSSEITTLLCGPDSAIKPSHVQVAINNFKRTGQFTAKQGKGKGSPMVFEVNENIPYSPRKAVMRKIAPNDKKAEKSIRRTKALTGIEKGFQPQINTNPIQSKKPELKLIQGLAAIDANDPNFEHFAKEFTEKMGPNANTVAEVPKAIAGPVKPIVQAMFIDIGTQSIVASPAEVRQLYEELHLIFGPKS